MKDGWLKIENAPLDMPGLVWCPAKSWGDRTDMIDTIRTYGESDERFVTGSFHGFEITHWHPLPKPPRTRK